MLEREKPEGCDQDRNSVDWHKHSYLQVFSNKVEFFWNLVRHLINLRLLDKSSQGLLKVMALWCVNHRLTSTPRVKAEVNGFSFICIIICSLTVLVRWVFISSFHPALWSVFRRSILGLFYSWLFLYLFCMQENR